MDWKLKVTRERWEPLMFVLHIFANLPLYVWENVPVPVENNCQTARVILLLTNAYLYLLQKLNCSVKLNVFNVSLEQVQHQIIKQLLLVYRYVHFSHVLWLQVIDILVLINLSIINQLIDCFVNKNKAYQMHSSSDTLIQNKNSKWILP